MTKPRVLLLLFLLIFLLGLSSLRLANRRSAPRALAFVQNGPHTPDREQHPNAPPPYRIAVPAMAPPTEGTTTFIADGEEFQTYYRIFGKLMESSSPPLIAVHGGPGLVCYYLTPLGDLSEKNESRPVIIYDQLGNGRSSHVPDKPSEFFTVKLYVDELENLISKLRIKEYHLLGHSWGGVLATELEVQRRPSGLKSIILTNSLAEMRLSSQSMRERVGPLDNAAEVFEGFKKGFEDKEAFKKAVEALHGRYALKYFTERPLLDDLDTFDWIWGNEDKGIKGGTTVSEKM